MTQAATDTMELVRRAADGDDDAFRELVRDVHPRLRRWALVRTGDPDDADEVVQRTLVAMHRALSDFDGRSRLTSWLYRILRNAATDLDRSRAARPVVAMDAERTGWTPADPGGQDVAHRLDTERLAAAVRDFFRCLPPRQREVLELVDHEGLSPAEVAELLELKPVTVRASLFKARRAVRRAMLERHPELLEGYER